MKASAALAARLSTAAAIAVSGYIHADLYVNGGYRHIHIIGTAFLTPGLRRFRRHPSAARQSLGHRQARRRRRGPGCAGRLHALPHHRDFRSRHLPCWAQPLAGGTLLTLITILWSSAALWQLTHP
jgi:hypothetical protein